MATMIAKSSDVIGFLKSQHEDVKAAFSAVLNTRGKERERAFFELRRLLAVHETAEEEIVHPAARRAFPDGNEVVEARLLEEKAAKKALAEIERLDVDSSAFDVRIRKLHKDVLAHAEAEEQEEFSELSGELDHDRLARMRKAVEIAEAVAPTRPHAGVESATANLIAGPFASMVDRARDALTTKR